MDLWSPPGLHLESVGEGKLHQLCFISDCQCYHIWKYAHRPCIYQLSNLIRLFFSDFLHILQLFFLHDCQYYYIWKCVHRPCAHEPSNLILLFFLIFCIFYSYISFMIANVPMFGNSCTDHVYISLPTSSLIFFLIFRIFYSCVSSLIAKVIIFRNVCTDHVCISPPTSSLILF
jgi:hypothetical protein